nr:tetratricopeptide repeat protein [Candidatus Njordarchaeota archaeon]
IGEFMDAIGDFSQALSLVASDDTHKRSQILYQRGYALMRLSKMREACKDASESLELDPGNERTTWLKSITCRSKPGSIT